MNPQDIPHARDRSEDYLASQVGRIDDELAALKVNNSHAIAAAVEAGIMRAVSNPDLWAAASVAIQQQAKARAGGWLFSGVGALFSKVGWLVMAGVAIYTLGGWTALAGAMKAWLVGSGHA